MFGSSGLETMMAVLARTLLLIVFVPVLLLVHSDAVSRGGEIRREDKTKARDRKNVTSLSAKEQDLLEQAFRHLLAENSHRPDYKARPYFLTPAVGDHELDVSDDFLRRFADVKLDIKQGTQWQQNAGTRLTVSIGQWVNETEVELDLKMYRHYLESLQYTCRFHLKNGKWQLKKGSERHLLQS